MKDLTTGFRAAAEDYLYLLERNYPQKIILKMVGDKYALSGSERTMLYRGLTIRQKVISRSEKLISGSGLKNNIIHVDGFNVIITLGSYLNGNLVYISNDHLLRDAAEIHGKVFRTDLTERAINLILSFLTGKGVSSVNFYFDSPVSKSKILVEKVNDRLRQENMEGSARTVPSPDMILKETGTGIIATSDSTIIDQTGAYIFDLPRHVLIQNFNPIFTDLRGLSAKNC